MGGGSTLVRRAPRATERRERPSSKETNPSGVSQGQAETAVLAAGSQASEWARETNTVSCSPKAQPSRWAAPANAPMVKF